MDPIDFNSIQFNSEPLYIGVSSELLKVEGAILPPKATTNYAVNTLSQTPSFHAGASALLSPLFLCYPSAFFKVKIVPMDSSVDALSNAYQDFLAAAAGVLEAKEASGSQKTAATDAALENFKQRWELFRVACDQAEEFVESVKQRIGSECLVDEATGSVSGKPGQPVAGLPPISAVRLEQMSKAVRWLVIELQQGSGNSSGTSHPNSSAPFDARFAEDTTQ